MKENTHDYQQREEVEQNFFEFYSKFRDINSWEELTEIDIQNLLNKIEAEEFGANYFNDYKSNNTTPLITAYKDYEDKRWTFMKESYHLDYTFDYNFMKHYQNLIQVITAWKIKENKNKFKKFEQIKEVIFKYKEQGYYIGIDTNIMLDFPYILSLWGDEEGLILSRKVYEELDGLKKGEGATGKQARNSIRAIENHQLEGKPLKIIGPDYSYIKNKGLDNHSPDDVIIGTYLKIDKETSDKVVFLSNDRGARIIARSVDLEVIDLQHNILTLSEELFPCAHLSFEEIDSLLIGKEFEVEIKPDIDSEDDVLSSTHKFEEEKPLEVQKFLKHYKDFRKDNLTWQELMRSNQKEVENKINAERYGFRNLDKYINHNPKKVSVKNNSYSDSIIVDYGYDYVFSNIYESLVCKKYVLENNNNLEYIQKVKEMKERIINHYNNGGYFAISYYILKEFPSLLHLFSSLNRILISKKTYKELQDNKINIYGKSTNYICNYIEEKVNRKEIHEPLPENPELVKIKTGWFKYSIPDNDELEVSSFLPLLREGKSIMYIGTYEEEKAAQKHGLPVFPKVLGMYFGEEMQYVIEDTEEDLMELIDTDIFVLEEDYDWKYFKYGLDFYKD